MKFALFALLGKLVQAFESIRWSKAGKRPLPGHTLYHFYVSPFAMKARKAIYRLELDIPMKDILNDDGACQELVSQGGKDQVPCLKIESKTGTRWMYESADIIKYLNGLPKVLALILIPFLMSCATTKESEKPQDPLTATGYALVDDLRLYYEVHGQAQPGVPPLVLLHGGGSTIDTSFSHLIPLFAKNRQVIAFDQQGHGRTADIKERPFSFAQSADDAAGLLEALKIPQADFMGYSNGGHIAIEIALRHPQIVRKLIIESAMISREGSDPSFWAGFRHPQISNMPAELKQEYIRVAPHPEDLQSFFEKSVQRMLHFKGWTPAQIRSISFPTFVLCGDQDVIKPEHAVKLSKLLPHARLAVLPNTNHMNIVDRGEWIAPMVQDFLNH